MLNKAARLLENKNTTIQFAAFALGFNDLIYFRKCFQKQFGINPPDYGNINQAE